MMSSSYPSRNNSSSRYRSSSSPSRSNYQSENKKQSSSSLDFIYKGGNKKQWAKLQSKINQQLKHENISYILDPAEIARRKTLPPPAVFLPPPLHYIESAADKELRARNQKFEDQNREKAEKKFDEYAEKFPIDFGKGIDVIYQLVSHTIIQDLDSHIEAIRPVTKNAEVQFMAILNRLGVKWGPTSKKDAVEIFRLINSLVGDYRGWDIFLTALKDLIEVLTQTPVRDAANNPVFEPVPIRPHIPHPPPHQPYAVYHAYFAADTAAQVAWDQAHPADRIKNHRPTDDNIKEIVILALADSSFVSYSSLAQRYQQTDHANHTWSDLHRDIESLIQNSARGTSRDPSSLVRPDRHRHTNNDRFDQHQPQRRPYPAEQRSVRHDREQYPTANDHRNDPHQTGHKRTHSATPSPQDVRAAIQPTPPSAITTTKFPCANCGGDHRSNVCDSTLCTICQATFPTAALRHAHYLSVHKRDSPTKRTRFAEPSNYRSTNTPPTSPFLQSRSARSDDGYASHSSYDSGYDSTASGPGHPPSIGASSDVDDQVQGLYYDVRTVTSVPSPTEPCLPCRSQPTLPLLPSASVRLSPAYNGHPNTRANSTHHHRTPTSPNAHHHFPPKPNPTTPPTTSHTSQRTRLTSSTTRPPSSPNNPRLRDRSSHCTTPSSHQLLLLFPHQFRRVYGQPRPHPSLTTAQSQSSRRVPRPTSISQSQQPLIHYLAADTLHQSRLRTRHACSSPITLSHSLRPPSHHFPHTAPANNPSQPWPPLVSRPPQHSTHWTQLHIAHKTPSPTQPTPWKNLPPRPHHIDQW